MRGIPFYSPLFPVGRGVHPSHFPKVFYAPLGVARSRVAPFFGLLQPSACTVRLELSMTLLRLVHWLSGALSAPLYCSWLWLLSVSSLLVCGRSSFRTRFLSSGLSLPDSILPLGGIGVAARWRSCLSCSYLLPRATGQLLLAFSALDIKGGIGPLGLCYSF